MVRSLFLLRQMARCGIALADHPESPDISAHGRDRGSAHNFAPESLGGVRNWDYRFCWVRDATLTLHSLLDAGYHDEARDWREWLLRAVAGSPSELNIVYGLRGERRLTELELPWLAGYENSAPVRTGNAAYNQFQLDIFGEVPILFFNVARQGSNRRRTKAKTSLSR